MGTDDELEVSYYAHTDDVQRRCLFTGVDVPGTKRGEHVIPRWLAGDYGIRGSNVELGRPEAKARVFEFTAPADAIANQTFGGLEQRIKEDQANVSDDELYLWMLKLSSGMLWNHQRLAGNERHPRAPEKFDARLEGIVGKEFQNGYAAWTNGSFSRMGSLTRLPCAVDHLMIVHIFGTTLFNLESETHEGIWPYVLMAVARPGHPLVVASFFDHKCQWEDPTVHSRWQDSPVASTREGLPVRAAIAAALYTLELMPFVSSEEEEGRLMDSVAYAAGVRLYTDDKGKKRFAPR